MASLRHLFVDISSHGFGHLAITAPVLNALAERVPGLALTVRTGLPAALLRQRLRPACTVVAGASDFGFVMRDALSIDRAASAAAYRAAHADWPARVAAEAAFLADLAPDLVFSNISYLPLAGAAQAGIPAIALCCLNWADLFAHFYGNEPWGPAIHSQILAAYRAAHRFLRITPGMAMAELGNVHAVGPIAARGRVHDLGLGAGVRAVLVALGGIDHRLPLEDWPRLPATRWLVPAQWHCRHPDAIPFETLGRSFTDLLASVDVVVTKPGYGTFTEAACAGTPVIYQPRVDWPEQHCLIDWLHRNGSAVAVTAEVLRQGNLAAALEQALGQERPPPPTPGGAEEAAAFIAALGAP